MPVCTPSGHTVESQLGFNLQHHWTRIVDIAGPEHRGVAITALFFGGPLRLHESSSQNAETIYGRPTVEGMEPRVEFGNSGVNLSPWWLSPRVAATPPRSRWTEPRSRPNSRVRMTVVLSVAKPGRRRRSSTQSTTSIPGSQSTDRHNDGLHRNGDGERRGILQCSSGGSSGGPTLGPAPGPALRAAGAVAHAQAIEKSWSRRHMTLVRGSAGCGSSGGFVPESAPVPASRSAPGAGRLSHRFLRYSDMLRSGSGVV